MKKTFIVIIALFIACQRDSAPQARPPKRIKIASVDAHVEMRTVDFLIDWQAEPTYLGIYYAKATKKFAARGLDVTIIQSWGANQAAKAVGTGRYLIGTASGGATVLAKSAGNDLVSMAVLYPHVSTVVYGLAGENVRRPQDLVGKRIGIYPNSITRNEFDAFMRVQGLSPDSVDIVSLSGPDLPLVLSGRVDGVLHYSEMSPALLATGGGSRRPTTAIFELPLWQNGVTGYGLNIITARQTLAEEPLVVKAMTDAVLEGYAEGCASQEKAVRTFCDEFPEKDVNYVRASWSRVCRTIGTTPGRQSVAGWSETIKLYDSLGLLSHPVKPESLLP